MRGLWCLIILSVASVAWAEEPIRVGDPSSTRWSETTVNAAKQPAEQAVLQQGQVASIAGEIVDVSCWLQLGKRGPGHVACGAGCIRNGQPIGLLTDDGQLYLVVAEEHDPRRGGLVSIREFFADRVGQTATVTGMLVTREGYRALYPAGAPLTPTPSKTSE